VARDRVVAGFRHSCSRPPDDLHQLVEGELASLGGGAPVAKDSAVPPVPAWRRVFAIAQTDPAAWPKVSLVASGPTHPNPKQEES
jgi:hypothetical protein